MTKERVIELVHRILIYAAEKFYLIRISNRGFPKECLVHKACMDEKKRPCQKERHANQRLNAFYF